ncbi:sigma-70 family RNA polymerase sigma factor [Azospirillum oleiclasticum]|uniref:sigma-70 family RNA polymerase sigma factor n=1 Tax=Azospirillum oleiclasticum TaxID=2735135 RepID=UPI0031B57EAC
MTAPVDTDAALFEERRRPLLRLAYRMLGSVAEAEDMVQEAWLRWQSADRAAVGEPAAFLTTVVTRLCLDQLKSARVRRETYVGAWLPEPLVESMTTEAADDDGLAGDLSVALMLTLERLSPLERAAFLLHDVFDLDFDAVARALGRNNATCRKLAARAREHVRASPARYPASPDQGEALTRAFLAATHQGDIATLQGLLAADAVLVADGGGKRPAVLNPLRGADRIARFFAGLARKHADAVPAAATLVRINGMPGFVFTAADGLPQTTALEIDGDRIAAVYIMRNPDKLGHVRAG